MYGFETRDLYEVGRALPSVSDLAAVRRRAARPSRRPAVRAVGFCFGSVIAQEMARQLEGVGVGPGLLVLFDTRRPGTSPPVTGWGRMRSRARKAVRMLGGRYQPSRHDPEMREPCGTPTGPTGSAVGGPHPDLHLDGLRPPGPGPAPGLVALPARADRGGRVRRHPPGAAAGQGAGDRGGGRPGAAAPRPGRGGSGRHVSVELGQALLEVGADHLVHALEDAHDLVMKVFGPAMVQVTVVPRRPARA